MGGRKGGEVVVNVERTDKFDTIGIRDVRENAEL